MSEVKPLPPGNLATRFLHGFLNNYLQNRERELQQKDKMELLSQTGQNQLAVQDAIDDRSASVQGSIDDRTHYTQGQMNDRNTATIEGANTRAGNKPPAPWKPTTEKEWRDSKDFEASLKAKYHVSKSGDGGEEKESDKATTAKKLEWDKYRENSRRGDKPDIYGHVPTHLVGQNPPPTYAGGELPYELQDEVAKAAHEMKIGDQEASNLVYARHEAEDAATSYGVDPRITALDVAKIRQLPSMRGRNLTIKNEDGRTNMYWLVGSLLNNAWTHQEVSDMLDEYFEIGNVNDVMQNPTGVK